jgi:hypothetical protein
MLEAGDGLSLRAESFHCGPAGVSARQDHFQRTGPLQGQMARQIDDAHAAAT